MAKLNKSVLGKISGSLGDITFRQRNGKNYISVRPNSFTPGTDPQSIKRRTKFALAVKLAKQINSITKLKQLWVSESPEDLTSFNYIMKRNYPYVDSESLPATLFLTPSPGFGIDPSAVNLDNDQLQISFAAIGASLNLDTEIEKNFQLVSLVAMNEPNDPAMEPFQFIVLESGLEEIVTDAEFSFNIPFSNYASTLVSEYNQKKAFSALLTLDGESKLIQYSNTIIS